MHFLFCSLFIKNVDFCYRSRYNHGENTQKTYRGTNAYPGNISEVLSLLYSLI